MEFGCVEHGEEDRSGISSHRHSRRNCADPAHAGLQPGDTANVLRLKHILVDIAKAVLIRYEVEATAVWGILRIDVLDLAEDTERGYSARGHVQECDLRLTVLEAFEVRNRPPIGDEGDGRSVRRPGGLKVGVFVVCVLSERASEDIPSIDVAHSPSEPGKSYELTVRGPGRTGNGPDTLERDFLGDVPALHIHDRQLVVSIGEHREDELGAVRRPVSRRVDEPQRIEMRVGVGADQLLQDLAGPRIGQEHVDPKEISLGEKSDVPPVRTHRRSNVLPPRPGGWGQEQRSGLTRSLPSGHEGKVLGLDGLSPPGRETV